MYRFMIECQECHKHELLLPAALLPGWTSAPWAPIHSSGAEYFNNLRFERMPAARLCAADVAAIVRRRRHRR